VVHPGPWGASGIDPDSSEKPFKATGDPTHVNTLDIIDTSRELSELSDGFTVASLDSPQASNRGPYASLDRTGPPPADRSDRLPRRADMQSGDSAGTVSAALRRWADVRPAKARPRTEAGGLTRDAETLKDRVVEASADYATAQAVNSMFPRLMKGDHAEPFPETQAAGAIETVSGLLQSAATSAFNTLATGVGLTSGEATISAGICSNFVLAPITGPLEGAATLVELAGLVVGLATGAHPLVLACIKPLVHTELKHALSHCIVSVIQGPHAAGPLSGAHTPPVHDLLNRQPAVPRSVGTQPTTHAPAPHRLVPPVQDPVPSAAPNTRREVTRNHPLWLCLGFAPRLPERSDVLAAGIGVAATMITDVNSTVVLPVGEDEFLRTLPAVLQRSTVSMVDIPTAKTMGDSPLGRHFILRLEGVGVGAFGASSDRRAAYKHPGCRTGQCTLNCRCLCDVCRSRLCHFL